MVKFLKFFGYFLFFCGALLFFLPKVHLYYLLEQELEPLSVVITDEHAKDKGFTLVIEDALVVVKGIEGAQIASIDVALLGFFNSVELQEIKLSEAAKSFVPLHVAHAKISHVFYMPTLLKAEITGEFGEAFCEFDLLEREFRARILPSQTMVKNFAHTLRNFKKEENGEYSYAKNI